MKKIGSIYSMLVLVILLTGLSSCSIRMEKRRYNSGYYIDISARHKNKTADEKNGQVSIKRNLPEIKLVQEPGIKKTLVKDTLVKVESRLVPTMPDKAKKEFDKKLDQCDVIYLYTGKKLFVTNIFIYEKFLTYQDCGNLKQRKPTPLGLANVEKIEMSNGEVFYPKTEMIKIRRVKPRQKDLLRDPVKKQRAVAIAMYFLAAFLGFALGALFFGLVVGMGWAALLTLGILFYIIGGIMIAGGIVCLIMALIRVGGYVIYY